MKIFEFKSGTKVMVDEHKLVIERTGGKSAVKGLFQGRTMGQMTFTVIGWMNGQCILII
jgi:hypothetical protein